MSQDFTHALAGGGLPLQRGASMTTDKHVDPAAPVPAGDEVEDSNLQDVPEGAVRFDLEPADIEEALAAPSMQVSSPCVTWTHSLYILNLHQHSCVHLGSRAVQLRAVSCSHMCRPPESARWQWGVLCKPELAPTVQVEAPDDVDVPKYLLSPEEVQQLVAERQPRFVPLQRHGPGSDATPPADSATGARLKALPLRLFAPSADLTATL